ncbi:MAG: hypothetical protein ACREMA_05625 [Longimicrobiales bacterium]
MRRCNTFAALFAMVLVAVGCDDPGPQVSFGSQRIEWNDSLTARATVDAAVGSVLVNGLVLTPNECFNLRASPQIRTTSITVTINGNQATNSCAPAPGAYVYTFMMSGIDRGSYQFKVIHAVQGTTAVTVADTNIAMP